MTDQREQLPGDNHPAGQRPANTLARILVVTDSEQHRETLAILLERECSVTAVREVAAASAAGVSPDLVVLSPTRWAPDEVLRARAKWPAAVFALVDATAATLQSVPGAIAVSWSDPLALRCAIVRAATPNLCSELTNACAELGSLLDSEIGRQLKLSKVLAELAADAPLPHSTPIARKIFGEQAAVLLERLIWVDIASADFPGAVETVDLGAIFSAAVRECAPRLFCRGVEIDRNGKGTFRLEASSRLAELIVRCLATVLLSFRSSRVRVRIERTCLAIEHPDLTTDFHSLPLVVVERLLRCERKLRLGRDPGCIGLYLVRE